MHSAVLDSVHLIVRVRPSVCLTACAPQSGIMSKLKLRSCGLHWRKPHYSSFLVVNCTAKFQRDDRELGRRIREGLEKTQLSANKSPYLRNGARKDHSYNDGLTGSRIRAFDWYRRLFSRNHLATSFTHAVNCNS